MGVAQLAYEPQLQTITANSQTGICASFKTWFKTMKVPFTSSQAGSVKLRAGAKSQQGHPRPQESNILNLSTIFHLSETETQLLERGLSFIPTPRISDQLKFRNGSPNRTEWCGWSPTVWKSSRSSRAAGQRRV